MAQESSEKLADLLVQQRETLAAEWTELVARSLAGRVSRAELDRELHELYDAILQAVRDGGLDSSSEAFGSVRALLAELSRNRARQGFTPAETAVSVFGLKVGLERQLDSGLGADVALYLQLSRLVDELGMFTVDTYARTREQIISAQTEELLELSTPVVKLWEGVVGVPLVGTLDSARTQVVMEKLLQALVDTGSEHAIIDITGVPAVDTAGRAAPAQDGDGGPADGRRMHDLRDQAADRADDRGAGHRVRRHRHQGDAGRRAAARDATRGRRLAATHGADA